MPQFNDDLFLGAAVTDMGMNLGNSSPMSEGVGPLGRIYVWDVVPLTKQTNNISVAATYSSAGNATLAAGTGTQSAQATQPVQAVNSTNTPKAMRYQAKGMKVWLAT